MISSYSAALYRHSHYHHKTLAGNILFYAGALGVIIAGFVLKKLIPDPEASKPLRTILTIIAAAVILLSFIVDLLLA